MNREKLVLIQDHLRAREKFQHDRTHTSVQYRPGDTVIHWRNQTNKDMGRHLQSWWTGPYKVVSKHSGTNYWVHDPVYDAKV